MRFLLCLLAVFTLARSAHGSEFKLYAAFNQDTEVELATGARWIMDKDEVFPVLMYKEMQTKVVLELADTNFRTNTSSVRILKADELPAGLARYRKSVENYLRLKAEKTKKKKDKKDVTLRP